jgi:DNA-binding Xre family transcriptional regulator
MTPPSPRSTLTATLRTVAASPADIADHIGGDMRRAIFRAPAGKPINAGAYLALCGAVGLDPVDGLPRPTRRGPAHVSWSSVGAALKFARGLRHQDQRSAAKAMGISAATLCRVEAVDAVSVETLVAVCKFIGTHPDHYSSA